MRSPDQPTFTPLSPDQKERIRRRALSEMQRIIERLEPLYLDEEQLSATQARSLDTTRYHLFEDGLNGMGKQTTHLQANTDQMKLMEDVALVIKLYRMLADLKQDRSIPEDLRKEYDLAPNEFRFVRPDIPYWSELPSEESLKRTYRLDRIFENDYSEGRTLEDFDLKGLDLLDVHYAEHDLAKREALLYLVDRYRFSETVPPAQIFDIRSIIADKRKQDPSHPEELTTKELLEAFDEAGVRPATLHELLAYSKKYWTPEDRDPSADAEVDQYAHAWSIYALGSAYSSGMSRDGDRVAPCLEWHENKRGLDGAEFNSTWKRTDRFLVFRKDE